MKRLWLIATIVFLSIIAAAALAFHLLNSKNHEQSCDQLREDAYRLQKAGKLADAENTYKSALAEAQHSDNALQAPLVLKDLVQLYAVEGKLDAQERTLHALLDRYAKLEKDTHGEDAGLRTEMKEGSFHATTKLAEVLQQEGKLEESVALYKVAVSSFREDIGSIADESRISEEYANALRKLGRTAEADQLKTANDLDNEGLDWKRNLAVGRDDCLQGRLESGERELEFCQTKAKRISDQASLAQLDSWLAQCYFMQHKYAQADQTLKESVDASKQASPHYTPFYLTLYAYVLERIGKTAQATDCLHQAYALDPTSILIATDQIVQSANGAKDGELAIAMLNWSWPQLLSIAGAHSPIAAGIGTRVCEQSMKMGRTDDASQSNAKVNAMNASMQGGEQVRFLTVTASILDAQKRYKEAEEIRSKIRSGKLR